MTDIDYTAGLSLADLVDWVHQRKVHFGLSGVDPALHDALGRFGILGRFHEASVFVDLNQAVDAFRRDGIDPDAGTRIRA
jgi:hypothetical protein